MSTDKTQSSANTIDNNNEYLDTTELGTKYRLTGAEIDFILRDQGYQTRVDGKWAATKSGATHCVQHSWTKNDNTVHKLKWNVVFIEFIMA